MFIIVELGLCIIWTIIYIALIFGAIRLRSTTAASNNDRINVTEKNLVLLIR